jgi:hypothetical protein
MIEVEGVPFGHRPPRHVDVVRVELDQREVLRAGELGQPLGDGGLAGRGTAGHADQERSIGHAFHEARTLPRRRRRSASPDSPTILHSSARSSHHVTVSEFAAELTERDRALLDFERTWWLLDVSRDDAIRARFQCSADEYYAELNRVLELPAAMDHDPLVVRRHQRRRARRHRDLLEPTTGTTADRGGAQA